MHLDHFGEKPLGLFELLDLQVGGAEQERELGVLRVDRTRRLECLHSFLPLAVRHEGLCEQPLQCDVLLVTAGDASEDVHGVRRPTSLQVYRGERLQGCVGFDYGARGAIECMPRVGHLRSGDVELTKHHPGVEERRPIPALSLLQLPLAKTCFGRGNGPIEFNERVRLWFRCGAPRGALLTPFALLRLCMRGRRRYDHRHHGQTE
jgi:hypothetical protein